jgi:hypothetical protein
MNKNPQFKKILNFQTRYLRSKSLKMPENLTWTRSAPKWSKKLALPSGKHAQPSFQDLRRYKPSNVANYYADAK